MGSVVAWMWARDPAGILALFGRWPVFVASTARTLILAGIGLGALTLRHPGKVARIVARAAPLLMLLIEVARVFEVVTTPSSHFTQGVLEEDLQLIRQLPSMTIALIALSLGMLLYRGAGWVGQVGRASVGVAFAFAALAVAGYLYGATYVLSPHDVRLYVGMSSAGAVCVSLLAAGVLATLPERGVMAIIASQGGGGVVARRLLLAAGLIPLFGLLSAAGQHAGLYPAPGATVIGTSAGLAFVVVLVLGTARSIDRKDAERRAASAWMHAAVDQMSGAVMGVDGSGKVIVENQAARVLGTALMGPGGQPVAEEDLPVMRALRSGEPIVAEEMLVREPSGHVRPVLASAAPVVVGDSCEGAVMVLQDIRILKELDRLREEWTALVAHDLRQPLSVVSLLLERLEEVPTRGGSEGSSPEGHGSRDPTEPEAPQPSFGSTSSVLPASPASSGSSASSGAPASNGATEPGQAQRNRGGGGDVEVERTRALVERMRANVSQIERMIRDLLDTSQIESKRLSIEPTACELGEVARTVVDGLANCGTRCLVICERPAWAWADAGRIQQVIGNLLSNAVKYGDHETPIEVTVISRSTESAGPLADGLVEVIVTNRGPQIPAADVAILFERFVRTSGRRQREPGLGLGLYISRGLVEAHGGNLWVDSSPAQTRFHFTLPAAPSPLAAHAPSPAFPSAPPPK